MPKGTFPGSCCQSPGPCSEPLLTCTSTGDPAVLAGGSGSVSCGITAPFLWVMVCARFCLCPSRLKSLFPPILWKSCSPILLAFNVRYPADSRPFLGSVVWEAWCGVLNLPKRGKTSLVLLMSSLWVTHPDNFPGASDGKASAYNVGDPGSIPGLGRSPGEGTGNPLQYSCLENPMDRGAW